MTNGARIRAMSDEELAKLLAEHFACNGCPVEDFCCQGDNSETCIDTVRKWLKQEAKMSNDKKVTIEISYDGDDLNLHVENPCGEKDNPALLTALMMIKLFQSYSGTEDESDN